jgi:1-acyl-sn-glycerol-3-phosphate acyltransferase
MIKSIIIWIFIGVIHTLLWGVAAIAVSVFTRNGKKVHFYCAAPWSKIILWGSGVKVEARGLERIESEKSYIFIPNHTSFFDIFVLLGYLPVDFKFIFKKEIMRVPLLGFAMRRAGYISIDRSSPAKARLSLNQAIDKIKNGASIVIFAEGTRSRDGHLQPLKRGAFRMAIASGSPVVPVAIKGAHEIMPKGSFTIKKGVIKLHIGRPVETTRYTNQTMPDLIERVSDSLNTMLAQGS